MRSTGGEEEVRDYKKGRSDDKEEDRDDKK